MSILIQIGLWLISLFTGPVVKTILTSVAQDLIAAATQKALPAIEASVKEMMARDDLTATQKFDAVQTTILNQFPDLGKSTVNSLIENTLNAIKKETV
jgi:hypothetical protein